MIPVVVVGGDQRVHRGEAPAADAQLLQLARVVPGEVEKLVGAVVEQAHVHALFGLAGQDLQHAAPEHAFVHDEELQEDEALRLLQLLQDGREGLVPQREIAHAAPPVHGIAAGAAHIGAQAPDLRRLPIRRLQNRRIPGDGLPGLVDELGKAPLQDPVPDIAAGIGVEQSAEDGQDQDHDDPGQLGAGVVAGVEQIEGHGGAQHRHQGHEVGQIVDEPVKGQRQQRDLDQQKQHDQSRAAEHRPQQRFLMLFQQPDALLVADAHRRLPLPVNDR